MLWSRPRGLRFGRPNEEGRGMTEKKEFRQLENQVTEHRREINTKNQEKRWGEV